MPFLNSISGTLGVIGTRRGPSFLATGGNEIINSGGYRIHKFTSTGTFTANGAKNIEYFVLAGGGSSSGGTAYNGGGGGGAGGLTISSFNNVGTNSYTMTVGGAGSSSSMSGIATSVTGGNGGSWKGGGGSGASGGGINRENNFAIFYNGFTKGLYVNAKWRNCQV